MAQYQGYYFQEGKHSYRLVAIAIHDTSKMSVDLNTSIQGRLAALAGQEYKIIRAFAKEPSDFEEYISDKKETIDEEVERRR